MNRTEYEQKIIQLQTELEELKKVKIEEDIYDDEIFLFSMEEYKKYKDKIPHINTWWWLRTPGDRSNRAAYVLLGDSVCYKGIIVDDATLAIRPVLKYNVLTLGHWGDGKRIWMYNFPWIVIDSREHLAVAEVPIGFAKFDDESNDYKNSHIRQWIKEWKENR